MALPIISDINEIIKEHGCSEILRERITFLLDQFADIEAKEAQVKSERDKLLSENSVLLQEKRGLTEQLRQLTDWDTQKARYHVEKLAPGVFAYKANTVSDTEQPVAHPEQLFCSYCFETAQKPVGLIPGHNDSYGCPLCGTKYPTRTSSDSIRGGGGLKPKPSRFQSLD